MAMAGKAGWALLALLCTCCALGALGCVELFGESKDSLATRSNPTWNYAWRGDDWTGTCATGKRQSPMNLPHTTDKLALGERAFRTSWSFQPMTSNGRGNLEVFNNGNTIQVQWAAGTLASEVLVHTTGNSVVDVLRMDVGAVAPTAVKRVRATPLQFHFHTDSEHTIDGAWYPLEMHIVHNVPQSELSTCPPSGCFTVLGVMFALSENDNPALDAIWEAMPMREGTKTFVTANKTIDINAILPKDRTYISYEGSLTTPPCSEGLLWHVLTTPVPISLNQLRKYQRACSLKECTANSNSTSGRKLHEDHDHDHHHDHHHGHAHADLGHAALVQRGMKEGFQLVAAAAMSADPTGRALLQTNDANPDAWTCTPVAAGPANRIVQPANGRIIRLFPWGQNESAAAAGASPAAVEAMHASIDSRLDDQEKLILGVGLGIGLGCTALVLIALAIFAATRSRAADAHVSIKA